MYIYCDTKSDNLYVINYVTFLCLNIRTIFIIYHLKCKHLQQTPDK